ncbi:isocitrate/isopropylmalate family dehydrogenase [Streptomyces sp. NPDC047014]|uniref:isocitrate/isopropylmalate family dehydrogenase n=1 Tax=Streptomyces sp. NPDC047014 TaxID=3155736 RepID=UPI0033F3C322
MTAPLIALAVGRGTGPELAPVFERVLHRITGLHGTRVEVVRSPQVYHSYVSLRAEAAGTKEIARLTELDAAHYEHFCREQAAAGVRAVFRTAINAQSLYLVRRRLAAVKVEPLTAGSARMLLVRDQAQGFYTGENHHTPDRVVRTMEFSRAVTEQILSYAVGRARALWPEGPSRVVMAYKYHLLDGALDDWTEGLSERLGVTVELFQPDTVNRNLITHGPEDRTLLVAGNEWADIMHVVLLDRYGSERQENRCTENVHLEPGLNELTEYQTVHGSADDLAGRNVVNPIATIRAAARIAERHAGCAGAEARIESALTTLQERGVRTPDLGGRASTTEVTEAVLAELCGAAGARVPGPALGVGTGAHEPGPGVAAAIGAGAGAASGTAPGTVSDTMSGAAPRAFSAATSGTAPGCAAETVSGTAPGVAYGTAPAAASGGVSASASGTAPGNTAGTLSGAAPGGTCGAVPQAACGAAPEAAFEAVSGIAPGNMSEAAPEAVSAAASGSARGAVPEAAPGGVCAASPEVATRAVSGVAPGDMPEAVSSAASGSARGTVSGATTGATSRTASGVTPETPGTSSNTASGTATGTAAAGAR